MSDRILEAQGVHYQYPDGTRALAGVDLAVGRGERLAIMGANGAGKSTLFLCFNGVLKPQQGTVLLDGRPVEYSPKGLPALRQRVGVVFQDPDNQLFSADVYGEISFGPMNLGLPEDEARERVEAVMRELNIGALADKPVHLLSGGQKKLIAIADVLVMRPDVILLDEPAAALDPYHAGLVDGIIDGLCEKGMTVIISTHDVNRALLWADSVALLDAGRVLARSKPLEIFGDPDLLRQANLAKPPVLVLYEALRELGILPPLSAPRSDAELAAYLKEYGQKPL